MQMIEEPSHEHKIEFAKFVAHHGRAFPTTHEYDRRLKIFAANYEKVRALKSKGLNFEVEINRFADLTTKEYQQMTNAVVYN